MVNFVEEILTAIFNWKDPAPTNIGNFFACSRKKLRSMLKLKKNKAEKGNNEKC